MASIPSALIVSLICLSQDHMGVQGETTAVFSSVGGDATLPCNNVFHPDCSSTVWLSIRSGAAALELFIHGKINPAEATHRAKRLSLVSDCSLHITDVTTEDAGQYTCEQYLREGGAKYGEDAPVYLSVLQVSASPNETEMEANSRVTLHCLLHTRDNCGGSVADKGVSLSWMDETGKELKNINISKTRTTPPCSITLTEELRGPNPVRTRTCQLKAGGQVQISVSHTIRVKGLDETTISAPSSSPREASSDGSSSAHPSVVHVAVRVATTISLFVAVIIVAVIYRMRSGDPQGKPNTSAHSVDSAVTSPSL